MNTILPHILNLKELYMPELVANYHIKYATQAAKLPQTAPLLPADLLVTDVIMKYLRRVPADEQLWTDNPIEYIRRETDLGTAYFSPRAACIELLRALCNGGYLAKFLVYASTQLQPGIHLLQKEAILLAIGSLDHIIKQHEQYAKEIESLL